MSEKTKYYLRLQLRLGKPLSNEGETLEASIAGRTVTIKPVSRGGSSSETPWLAMKCRDFETADQAREFGEDLQRATHLAGLCTMVGVDAGDPSADRELSWVNPDVIREVNPDVRIVPDIHGLAVLPDDDGNNVHFSSGPTTLSVIASAELFVRALEESLPNGVSLRSSPPFIRRAIRILSLAQIYEEPITKLVLAVSVVEGLATEPTWTEKQVALIDSAAEWLEQTHGDGEGVTQVAEAIRKIRRESIRQRVKKLLQANDLLDMWRDWDRLYSRRSTLFHDRPVDGSEHRGSHLDEASLHALGQEAIKLSARIVLSIAKREGIAIPDLAKAHFGVEQKSL